MDEIKLKEDGKTVASANAIALSRGDSILREDDISITVVLQDRQVLKWSVLWRRTTTDLLVFIVPTLLTTCFTSSPRIAEC